MQVGDRVYYLYTGKLGTEVKFAAVVLGIDTDGVLVRVGRYDAETREIRTFDATVAADTLEPRSVPCSFEDALTGNA